MSFVSSWKCITFKLGPCYTLKPRLKKMRGSSFCNSANKPLNKQIKRIRIPFLAKVNILLRYLTCWNTNIHAVKQYIMAPNLFPNHERGYFHCHTVLPDLCSSSEQPDQTCITWWCTDGQTVGHTHTRARTYTHTRFSFDMSAPPPLSCQQHQSYRP